MAYRVWIQGHEVITDSLDDLQALLDRFGSGEGTTPDETSNVVWPDAVIASAHRMIVRHAKSLEKLGS